MPVKRSEKPAVPTTDIAELAWPPATERGIREYSEELLAQARHIKDSRAGKRGMRQDRISMKLPTVRAAAALMLDSCSKTGRSPPTDLVALISYLLTGTANASENQERFNREAIPEAADIDLIVAASSFEAMCPDATLDDIAKRCGIDRKRLGDLRNTARYKLLKASFPHPHAAAVPQNVPALRKRRGRPRSD